MNLILLGFFLISVIVFIFVVNLILKKPLYGLILVMAFMPFDQRFSLSSPVGSLSFSNIFLVLTFFSFAFHWIAKQKKIKTPPFFLFMWFWYVISTFWGLGTPSARMIVTSSAAFLLFFLMIEITSSIEDSICLCRSLAWISFCQALMAIFFYSLFFLTGSKLGIMNSWISGTLVPRAIGVHLDPNYLGISLFMGFSLSLSLLFSHNGKRIFFIVPLIVMTAMFITYSRTVWVGGITILVIFLTNKLFKNYGLKKLAMLGIVTISIFSAAFLPFMVNRFTVVKSFVESTERSISPRYTTFKEAVGIITQNPIFGVGTTQATEQYTHNTFLYAGLRSGLFGMIPLLIIVFYPVFSVLRSFKVKNEAFHYIYMGGFAGLLATILGAMTMGIEGHKLLWITVSLSYVILFQSNSSSKSRGSIILRHDSIESF